MTFATMAVHRDLQGIDLKDVEEAVDSGKIAFAEVSVDWAACCEEIWADSLFDFYGPPER